MHPHEDRPEQGYWEDEAPPDPTLAQSTGEFVVELRVLLEWSGLSLPEIEHRVRAYDEFVAEGTLSNALRGDALPSEELLLSLLWAVGCDDETVEIWVRARARLMAASAPKYSEGTLANAVKERRDKSGWRGLHRRSIPDSEDDDDDAGPGDGRHSAKRSASRRAVGNWSSRAMIGLVIAGVIAFGAGIVFALSGGGEAAAPPGDQRIDAQPTAGSPSPPDPFASGMPTDAPTPNPSTSTKPVNTPTPRPSTTTQGPPTQPQPTQTHTQPQLNASGSASCAPEGDQWVVTVTISATLSGATSGNDARGRAGYGGTEKSFDLSGSGPTFNGQTTIDVGLNTAPVQGSVSWRASVGVPGGDTVDDDGSASFNCTSASS